MSHTPTPWTMNDKGPGIEGPRFTVDGHDERGPWLVATVTRPCDAALIVRAVNCHEELLEALREIAKGEGPFSRDPLTHASNTIDAMKKIAQSAIAHAEAR